MKTLNAAFAVLRTDYCNKHISANSFILLALQAFSNIGRKMRMDICSAASNIWDSSWTYNKKYILENCLDTFYSKLVYFSSKIYFPNSIARRYNCLPFFDVQLDFLFCLPRLSFSSLLLLNDWSYLPIEKSNQLFPSSLINISVKHPDNTNMADSDKLKITTLEEKSD